MSRIVSARTSAISAVSGSSRFSSRRASVATGDEDDDDHDAASENTPLLESANRSPAELMDAVDDQK